MILFSLKNRVLFLIVLISEIFYALPSRMDLIRSIFRTSPWKTPWHNWNFIVWERGDREDSGEWKWCRKYSRATDDVARFMKEKRLFFILICKKAGKKKCWKEICKDCKKSVCKWIYFYIHTIYHFCLLLIYHFYIHVIYHLCWYFIYT